MSRLPYLLPLLLWLAVCCGGCERTRAVASRWPKLEAPPPLTYTPEEEAVLAEFGRTHPELARKILRQAKTHAALLAAYEKQRRQHEKRRLEALGLDADEIRALLGEAEAPEKD